MKTKIILLLMISYSMATAQNQIDSLVKSDKKIDQSQSHLIYDYRLPDWGFDRIYFDFSSILNETDRSAKNVSRNMYQHHIQLNPYYYSYAESENKIFSIEGSMHVYNSYSKYDTKMSYDSSKSNYTHTNLDVNLTGELHQYFNEIWFLFFNTTNYYSYHENQNKWSQINDGQISKSTDLSIRRQYKPSGRIGIGFGKLRNVTPVFRTLRFNERLKQLNNNTELTDADLIELANFFTRKNIYDLIYDRSNKYFYQNLPENVQSRVKRLEPWELMYVNETWNEILGDRFEGFKIHSGLSISYNKNYYTHSFVDAELFLIGLYVEQIYYHNISTDYQVGVNFDASLSKAVNNNTPYDILGNGSLKLLNLWNVTDKMLIDFVLGGNTRFESSKSWQKMNNYFTEINLWYFIENNLSFNTQVTYKYLQNSPEDISFYYDNFYYHSKYEKETTWSVLFRLRYYIKRGLF